MKMQYEKLVNREFVGAMQKLHRASVPGKLAFKIKRLGDALEEKRKAIVSEYQSELAEKFAARDEKGQIKRPAGDEANFDIDEAKRADFVKAQQAFMTREFSIEVPPLKSMDLENLPEITALDLKVLEPVYVDLSVV